MIQVALNRIKARNWKNSQVFIASDECILRCLNLSGGVAKCMLLVAFEPVSTFFGKKECITENRN